MFTRFCPVRHYNNWVNTYYPYLMRLYEIFTSHPLSQGPLGPYSDTNPQIKRIKQSDFFLYIYHNSSGYISPYV